MSYAYDQRKRPQGQQKPASEPAAAPGPDLRALMTGAARPTAAQKGRPIDLDAAMKAKMEHAFGDLSNLKLYESPTVGRAGAEAIAQGNEIAFAPGMADFSTQTGQERLGHELSHVMSQRAGAVRGEGFLASSALEAKADREGAMAAAGEQVYAGPVTHALSSAAPAPSAAGPMQAKRGGSKKPKSKPLPKLKPLPKPKGTLLPAEPDPYDPNSGPLKTDDASIKAAASKQYDDPMGVGNDAFSQFTTDRSTSMRPNYRPGMDDTFKRLTAKYQGKGYNSSAWMQHVSRPKLAGEDEGVHIEGLVPDRILPHLLGDRGRNFNMSEQEIEGLMDKLMAPHRENMSTEEQEQAGKQFDEGVKQYKGILMDDMKSMEKTYGTLPGQMHPHDVIPQMGMDYHKKYTSSQDALQMIKSGGKYFDFENNAEDKKFRDLTHFYVDADNQLRTYADYATESQLGLQGDPSTELVRTGAVVPENKAVENSIQGPKMNAAQLKTYKSQMKKRAKKGGWKNHLFGRYK